MIRTQLPNMKPRSSNRRRANIICPSCGKREPKPGRLGLGSDSGLCVDCTQSEMRIALQRGRSRVGAVLPHEQRRIATKPSHPRRDPLTPVSSVVNHLRHQAGSTRPSKKATLRKSKKTVNEGGVVTRAKLASSDRKAPASREESESVTRHTSAMDDVDASKTKLETEIVEGDCAMIGEQACSVCSRLVTQDKELCDHCLITNQDNANENPAYSVSEDEDDEGDKSVVDTPDSSTNETGACYRTEKSIQGCVKCDRITFKKMCGGPDGPSTLCNRCGREYMHYRLPLYQRPDGTRTAVYTDGLIRVEHTGFEKRGSSRNLQKPITSSLDTGNGQSSFLNPRSGNAFTPEVDRNRGTEAQTPGIPVGEIPIIELSSWGGQDGETIDADGALHVSAAKRDGTETDGKIINNLLPTPDASAIKTRSAVLGIGRRRTDPGVSKVISKKSGSAPRGLPIRMFIKAVYMTGENRCVRRFPIDGKLSYTSLRKKFGDMFSIHDSFSLEYSDNEGDLVAMSTDAEVEELYRVVAAHDMSPVRFQLRQEQK